MLLSPEVLTIGFAAFSIPEPRTASSIASTASWSASPAGIETRYSTPPSNSIPQLSFGPRRPKTDTATITAETEYQSHFRPTKSIETRPS